MKTILIALLLCTTCAYSDPWFNNANPGNNGKGTDGNEGNGGGNNDTDDEDPDSPLPYLYILAGAGLIYAFIFYNKQPIKK